MTVLAFRMDNIAVIGCDRWKLKDAHPIKCVSSRPYVIIIVVCKNPSETT
jgi:hypothetical protein